MQRGIHFALVATLVLLSQTLALANEVDESVISVSGSASLQVDADRAMLGFGVEMEGETASAALAANSKRMNAVVEALRQVGVGEQEISTAQFNIAAVYDRQQDRETGTWTQTLKGYRVSNLLNVETDRLEQVAAIIDAAVEAGANRVDRISFGLSRELQERSREQLIEAAVNNALSKAQKAIAPLDYELVGVKNMTLADHAVPIPRYAESARMDMAVSAAPPVFAGDESVSTTVNVTFLIEHR